MLAMLKFFVKKFKNENMSIISGLFYGVNHFKIQCTNCNIIKHNFEIFPNLVFDLEAVKKYKINILMQKNFQMDNQQMKLNYECFKNLNSVTIFDCFDYSSQIQTLQGVDAIPCDNCRISNNISLHQTVIYSPPEILILILDRSQQSKIKLEFMEDLNLSNYIEEENFRNISFKLISVVTEEENKNFIAYCKNLNEQQWYRYDDNTINKVNNFKSQIVDSGLVHILFYQKYTGL